MKRKNYFAKTLYFQTAEIYNFIRSWTQSCSHNSKFEMWWHRWHSLTAFLICFGKTARKLGEGVKNHLHTHPRFSYIYIWYQERMLLQGKLILPGFLHLLQHQGSFLPCHIRIWRTFNMNTYGFVYQQQATLILCICLRKSKQINLYHIFGALSKYRRIYKNVAWVSTYRAKARPQHYWIKTDKMTTVKILKGITVKLEETA